MSRRGPQGPRRERFICAGCEVEKPRVAFLYTNGTVSKRCTDCRERRQSWWDAKADAAAVRPGQPMSDREVAAELGITRQRVQQIEARALAKLRARAPWLVDMLRAS